MDEHIEDFEDRIYAILSTKETKDKKNIVTVDFVGFNDSKEMKLFKDFIAVTLGINQFKQDNVIDRESTMLH